MRLNKQLYSDNLPEKIGDQQFSGKKMLALDALSKLVHQFSAKPDIETFVKTFLLTLSGQFSILSSFALILRPGSPKGECLYIATGKYVGNACFRSQSLSSEMRKYFLGHKEPYQLTNTTDQILPADFMSSLHEHGAGLIYPLIHNDLVIGIICIGERVTRKPLDSQDVELLGTLIDTMTPLLAGSYHYWELASQSTWYFNILNNVNQGVFVFNDELRLKIVNNIGFEIIRLHRSQLTNPSFLHGKLIDEIFDESIFIGWAKEIVAASKKNISMTVEDLTTHSHDIPRHYDLYICRLAGKSEFEGDFLVTLDDITDKKKAEEQESELREKLERSERMESLGILAGGVAHDLNNMLGPLVGYPELILMKLPEDSPIRKQIQRIGASAKGAAQVVQDLLSLARRGRYEMEPVNINAIVEAYLDSPGFLKLAEERPNIKVQKNLDRNIGNIIGSAPHLSKVIMNLTVNAFDAMPDGGRLEIESSRKYLTSLLSNHDKIEKTDYAILKFRDTGMGIDKKDIERIFEPYYSKKKMGKSGSGLGLSVVYGILGDHKGHYDIISEPGQGTEFILYFPITKEAIESAEIHKDIGGSENVLIIDDVEEQREIASDFLTSLGYKVRCCSNGSEAIRDVEKKAPDILVMDMFMEPGFDGLDTFQEIIKKNPRQKAVIVSGFSTTERVEKMQKLGAGSYIRKPFTLEQIGQAVREELNRHKV